MDGRSPPDDQARGIGPPVRRTEDHLRLLAGKGCYSDDVNRPGQAYVEMVNAIVDALAELGVRHVEMPATPERVWRAIREARRSIDSAKGRA